MAYNGQFRFSNGVIQGINPSGQWENIYGDPNIGGGASLNWNGSALAAPMGSIDNGDGNVTLTPGKTWTPGVDNADPSWNWLLQSQAAGNPNYQLSSSQLPQSHGFDDWLNDGGIAALMGAGLGGFAALGGGAAAAGGGAAGGFGSLAGGELGGSALADSILAETGGTALGGATAGTYGGLAGSGLGGSALADSIIAEMGGTGAVGDAVAGTYGGAGLAGAGAAGAAGAAGGGTGGLSGTALSDSIISETGAGGIGNAGWGTFGATEAAGAAAAAKAAADAAKTTALQKIINGTSNPADWAQLAGQILPGVAGAIGLNEQAGKLSDLAGQSWNAGAPSRGRYEASMTPGFDPYTNIAGYKSAVDDASNSQMRALSTQGNPFGNPGGLIEAQKKVVAGTAMPAIQNYQNQNATTGGFQTLAGDFNKTAQQAIGSGSGVYSAIGQAGANVLNPQQQNPFASLSGGQAGANVLNPQQQNPFASLSGGTYADMIKAMLNSGASNQNGLK